MSRTPEQIKLTLAKIKFIWEKYPQLRLGQLIANVLDMSNLYYVDDSTLITYLAKSYKVDLNEFSMEDEVTIKSNTECGVTNKGKVFIHKGNIVKLIQQSELPDYEKQGFTLGMKDK